MKFSKKMTFLVLGVLLFGLTVTAHADIYMVSGQHSFWVSVRNQYFKDIQNARGYAFVNGTTAQIQVQAPGYRDGYTTVFLPANQFQHRAEVRLNDPSSSAYVRDNTGKFVSGAYANTFSQNMYWGDEFGITGYLPKAGFASLTERLIQVRVNGGYTFAPRIYLTGYSDRWNFEIVIRRADMNSFSNNIDIIVPLDGTKQPSQISGEEIVSLAKDYRVNALALGSAEPEKVETLKNRLESLSNQLTRSFRGMDEGEQRSLIEILGPGSPLAKEFKTITTFEHLYK